MNSYVIDVVPNISRGIGQMPDLAASEWWTMTRRQGESASAYCSRIIVINRLSCKTVEDLLQFDELTKFIDHHHPRCSAYVKGRNLKMAREAAQLAMEYENSVKPYRASVQHAIGHQHWRGRPQHQHNNQWQQLQHGSYKRSDE